MVTASERENIAKRKTGGSLTVEAALIFPLFLSLFFLLLFFIRIACVNIALDHAVKETAKEIAASSYPLSFFHEMEDEIGNGAAEDGFSDIYDGYINEKNSNENNYSENSENLPLAADVPDGNIFVRILSGQTTAADWKMLASFGEAQAAGEDLVFLSYLCLKEDLFEAIARDIMEKRLKETGLDPANLMVRQVYIPTGESAFTAKLNSDQPFHYEESGLVPGKDFSRDDVVIQVEYRQQISLPFLESRSLLLRHTAVEKAWLAGSYGIYTTIGDKSVFDSDEPSVRYVYVARYSKRYHVETCRYLRKSKFMITREEAAERKLLPCKICRPGV